ncbi:RNA-binding S4 domain-containing protein [Gracilibacillus thailandensis]|jgi:ribosomal 50S subunit-recycling heat shock protein|uniref:RQC P-site tRNA stabilizing factor n=1 Tax=Gracilibacillus thailandensis TaxID=563735 RepID=A0A6N7R5M0_9BACI|nr:RNA-binding S4 domain-containing protein [Gracilibacillus thailandensis]MRI68448.1 RNA-binding S4 domain-containing protein [Gracilibacillus thailandensis]
MRLDKFLKVSRLIKRRTLAKEIADQGRILINGNVAKAATNVAVGDEMKIQFGQKLLTIQIDDLRETVKKDEASNLYTIKHEEYINQ